jgi:hypothetical protein
LRVDGVDASGGGTLKETEMGGLRWYGARKTAIKGLASADTVVREHRSWLVQVSINM